MTDARSTGEAGRLEELWAGDFGDEYVTRNLAAGDHREQFWTGVLDRYEIGSALEIGCNIGANLRWIAPTVGAGNAYGIDVNRTALAHIHQSLPDAEVIWSPARDLPFRDRRFDLVFTMGVLIHQPEETLPLVLSEMVRTSARYVLFGEYYGESTEEVPYRGHEGALFRRNYGAIFESLFPDLRLVETGFLSRDEGWDDITWWLYER
ncbi:MAG: methyltransferase domain-containing protein [Acidimicrobiales bacterium]|nr:methyltransferase domain-containing protein [Acidimicrobiales bacterium]MCB1246675.1 methyltransferase domain-containing protein [Acidimicrobiia bacterium]